MLLDTLRCKLAGETCTLLFDVQLLRLGGEHIVSKNISLDKFTKPMLLGTLRHKLGGEVHCKHLFFDA